jgi:hypothetical protein
MTNYDRWKLATPDYLEDTDEKESVHDTDADGEDGNNASSGGESDTAYEKARVC